MIEQKKLRTDVFLCDDTEFLNVMNIDWDNNHWGWIAFDMPDKKNKSVLHYHVPANTVLFVRTEVDESQDGNDGK